MSRSNFSMYNVYNHSNDVVTVNFTLPSGRIYPMVRLYQKSPGGNYHMFADLVNVQGGIRLARTFWLGGVGGEREIYIKASTDSNWTNSAFVEDYGYVTAIPDIGSSTSPVLTSVEVGLYKTGKYVVEFLGGYKIGSLVTSKLKTELSFWGGLTAAVVDPIGILFKTLTGFPEPAVGDYFRYEVLKKGSRYTSGTIEVQDYTVLYELWRKPTSGAHYKDHTDTTTYKMYFFRSADKK